jgi:hypothetical protein
VFIKSRLSATRAERLRPQYSGHRSLDAWNAACQQSLRWSHERRQDKEDANYMAQPAAIRPLGRSAHVRICVHGDPGAGKSRLVGTSEGKVLILRPPFEHVDSIITAGNSSAEEWVIPDWDEMDQVLEYLRMEGKVWDWVWLDSISLWQDAGLDDIWETVLAEKPARARYGLDRAEYGINMMRLARWVRNIVGPDTFNFGVTAHSEPLASPDKDEDGDPIVKLMPWVQGKQMANKVCGYMNLVTFLEVKELDDKFTRVLHTTSTEIWYGKNQFDKSGDDWAMRRPTIPGLITRVEEARSKKSATTTKRRPRRKPTRR